MYDKYEKEDVVYFPMRQLSTRGQMTQNLHIYRSLYGFQQSAIFGTVY